MSIYEDTCIIEITKILQTGIFQQLVVQFFSFFLLPSINDNQSVPFLFLFGQISTCNFSVPTILIITPYMHYSVIPFNKVFGMKQNMKIL